MKCSNFYKMVHEIKAREQSELSAALHAHGGSYDFYHRCDEVEDADTDDEDYDDLLDECPHIACNPDNYYPEPMDVIVLSVTVDKCGIFEFDCIGKRNHDHQSVEADDIFPGQIDFIIDAIPETDKVKDVTGM